MAEATHGGARPRVRAGGRHARARAVTALALLLLLFLTFLRVGREVPSKNELLYVVRLVQTYAPDPLATDFTVGAAHEHYVFNHLAGLLMLALPLEPAAWIGRIVSWAAVLWVLLALGRRLGAGTVGAVTAIAFWVGAGQSLVADSWVLGTFEAKCVAYPLVFGALLLVMRGRTALAGLLAGLSATFHPSVGLFGAIMCGIAACVPAVEADGAAHTATPLSVRTPFSVRTIFTTLVRFGVMAFLGALPGAIALLPSLLSGSAATDADWMQAVRVDQPYHLDPFTFTKGRMAALGLQLLVVVALAWRSRSTAWRRAAAFTAAGAAVFAGGIAARALGVYDLLASFPFRLFPLVTPLVFLFALAYIVHALVTRERIGEEWTRARRTVVALGGAVGLVMLPDPITPYIGQLMVRDFTSDRPAAPVREAFAWVDAHLPEDATGLVPPDVDRFAFHEMGRPLVVATEYPVYDHLTEWHERVRAVGGETAAGLSTFDRRDALAAHFDRISEPEMRAIMARYGADFLIARTAYAFPIAFEDEGVRVYLSPAANDTSGSESPAS